MTRDIARLIATLGVWILTMTMTAIVLTSPTGAVASMEGPAVFGIMLVLSLAAMVSTAAIWTGGRGAARDSARWDAEHQRERAKLKREGLSRAERLIQQLDDDDIYDLEALLLAREEADQRHRHHMPDA